MGAFVKLVDFLLFFLFLVIALAAPLFDAQTCLPSDYFPEALVDLKEWYGKEFGDYLTTEKPHFFVGMIWLELLFQWPLAILNLYAILGSKPWFNTSCLIYGASLISTMVPILADMVLSEKDTEKMMMIYAPFLGAGVVALLRGFVPHSAKSGSGAPKRPAFGRKKRV